MHLYFQKLHNLVLSTIHIPVNHICFLHANQKGRDSLVGMATCYGLDGPRSNPGEGEIFRTRPDRSWGPPSLLYYGYRVFPGVKAAGAWHCPPTPPSAKAKERVGLYLFSPFEPSWPVLV
jgi:hypothetical protein